MWSNLHLWQFQPIRDVLVIAGLFGLLYLGYMLSIVTVPILLALALAYLFEPLVARLTRDGRFGRAHVAASIVLASIVLVAVPAAIGVGFSVIQGVKYVQRVIVSIERVSASVKDPENTLLRNRVRGSSMAWLRIRDYIATERAKAKAAEQRRKAEAGAGASSPDVPGDGAGVPKDGAGGPADGVKPLEDGASSAAKSDSGESGQTPVEVGERATKQATKPMDGPPVVPPKAGAAPVLGSNTGDLGEEPSDLFRVLEWTREMLQENANDIGKNVLHAGGGALGAVFGVLKWAAKTVATVLLTGFFFFFFSTGYGAVLKFWEGLLPEQKKGRALELIAKMDMVISGFIRGRLTICAVMVFLYTTGYMTIGVPAPWIVGPIIGLLTLMPYAAAMMTPIVMILMLLEPSEGWQGAWWWAIAGPILILAISQVLDDYILTPRIQGKTTNMDMPTILFASIAGGTLAGFYGLLLAIPTAACIKILLGELFWPRFKEWAKGKAEDMLPISKE